MKVLALILSFIFLYTLCEAEKIVFCYYGSWAVYRPDNGKMDITDIDPKLCTHVGYTFFGMNADGSVKILDPWRDLGSNPGEGLNGIGKLQELKKQNPKLKTIAVVGGWNEGSTKYSEMARNPNTRKNFVKSVVSFVKKYGFNGFDLDWEYPAQRGGHADDVKAFATLVKELKAALKKENLSLSAAVAATKESASQSYNIPEISKHFDFINVMTYDLHGSWDGKTGHNAPLYSDDGRSVKDSVEYWLKSGLPAEKLVLGLAFYGRSFTLNNAAKNGVGESAAVGKPGPYTREGGLLGYNEICENIKSNGWKVQRDNAAKVPYAFKGDQWVGYDDVQSIEEKIKFASSKKLAGVMMWSIETDDFRGACGTKYPLLKAMNKFK